VEGSLCAFFENRIEHVALLFGGFWEVASTTLVPLPGEAPHWDPGETRERAADAAGSGNAFRLLRLRVNRLIELLQWGSHYPQHVNYYLQIHLDRHIPYCLQVEGDSEEGPTRESRWTKTVRVINEDNMPDMVNDLLGCIVPDVSKGGGKGEGLGEQETYARACAHIIAKCLPKSCLMRNMPDAIAKKSTESACFAHAVCDIVTVALLGNFRYCTTRMPFATRKQVMSDMAFRVTPDLAALLGRNRSDMLVYYCLREYLAVISHYNPSLYGALCHDMLWLQFELGTQSCMAKIREIVVNNLHVAGRTLWESLFLDTPGLEIVKRLSKKVPRYSAGRPHVSFQTAALGATKKEAAAVSPDMDSYRATVSLMQHMRPSMEMQLRWVTLTGIGRASVDTLRQAAGRWAAGDAAGAKVLMGGITGADAGRVHRFMACYIFMKSVCRIRLPETIAVAQLAAVRRRFPHVPTELAVRRAAEVLVCVACGNIKNFVPGIIRGRTTKQRRDVVRAHGVQKVTHNSDAGGICCSNKSGMCEHVLLLRLPTMWPASGTSCILQIGAVAVAVAPCCGLLCTVDTFIFTEGGPGDWACPACIKAKEAAAGAAPAAAPATSDRRERTSAARRCEYCERPIRTRDTAYTRVLKDDNGDVRPFMLCNRHAKSWMEADPPLSKKFVFDNMYRTSLYD